MRGAEGDSLGDWLKVSYTPWVFTKCCILAAFIIVIIYRQTSLFFFFIIVEYSYVLHMEIQCHCSSRRANSEFHDESCEFTARRGCMTVCPNSLLGLLLGLP